MDGDISCDVDNMEAREIFYEGTLPRRCTASARVSVTTSNWHPLHRLRPKLDPLPVSGRQHVP